MIRLEDLYNNNIEVYTLNIESLLQFFIDRRFFFHLERTVGTYPLLYAKVLQHATCDCRGGYRILERGGGAGNC